MSLEEDIRNLAVRDYEWDIPWAAVELIARAESCRLNSYRCPAGVWTIGWGETDGIGPGMKWTKEQADKTFNREVNKFARRVSSMLTNYANANQLGAMTSLAYNIGLDAFKNKSTVFKAHNADDAEAAARAFSLWNKARVNGVLVPLRGLTLRRTKEAALYLSPEFSTVEDVGVQAVQEESNLTKSPINVGGATSVAAGSVAGVSAVLNEFTPVLDQAKDLAMTFSINPGIVFAVILIGGGAATMYWRYKQRKGGWA